MDPLPETISRTYVVTAVPRKFPVPEGPPGPPALAPQIVAAPVVRRAQELLDPVAAEISQLIRAGVAGIPEAMRELAEAAPAASTVFQIAGAGAGLASLAAGVSGAAAKLLAGPSAALPYVGPFVSGAAAVWGSVSPVVTAGLGTASTTFQALATGTQAFPVPDFSQWGQLSPAQQATPGAILPPPVTPF